MTVKKKRDSLLFKFAIIFIFFTIIMLLLNGLATYFNQMQSYQEQCEANIRNITEYLEKIMIANGTDFENLQTYYMEHFEEMNIRYDFSGNYKPEKLEFESKFQEEHPGKVLGVDITFSELSEELKMSYAVYQFEYWLNAFEKAKESFGIEYTYYLVPTAEKYHMVYMIDGVREKKEVGSENYIMLGIDVLEEPEKHQSMWEAWNTGRRPDGYDTYDNEFGKTYAYYAPFSFNGNRMGVIGAEVTIASVNKAILNNTLRLMAGSGAIMILCAVFLLWILNKRYISKIGSLESSVRKYAIDKNAMIVGDIEKEIAGKDEISSLSKQVVEMILELEEYMKSLLSMARDLSTTKKEAEAMHELAQQDSLTGVRNKTAYDREVERLEWTIAENYAKFGIAMVDLNYLKRINDTYGHEQGNVAIKKLCHLICSIFSHSPVFRIGGDEFVVILERGDYKKSDQLVKEFNEKLEEFAKDETLEEWERISAAIGVAKYDYVKDGSVPDVFKRADKAMYARKRAMKAARRS